MSEVTADRASDVYLVGRRHSPHVQDMRDLLSRNRLRFAWVDLDHGPLVRALGQAVRFFAGDVRHGSIKRVASAVGEGAVAVQQVHRFLAEK